MSKKNNEIDKLLYRIMPKVVECMLNELPSVSELEETIILSQDFEKNMSKIIRFSKKLYFPLVNTLKKRVAVLLMVLVITLSVPVVSIEALREPVVNFIIETYEKFTAIFFKKDEPGEQSNYIPESIEEKFEPSDIPYGYDKINSLELSYMYQITYSNSVDDIVFEQYIVDSSDYIVDTENANLIEMTVNNKMAYYLSNNGEQRIIWTDNKYWYTIYGLIEKEKLISMAETLITSSK